MHCNNCPLCLKNDENVLITTPNWRIITVHDEINAPAFCRVIWHNHVAEMSDLSPSQRTELMEAVFATETAMRHILNPAKINLASLGNQVPHLHWHVIARFVDDACFPAPIWSNTMRQSTVHLPTNWIVDLKITLSSYFSIPL